MHASKRICIAILQQLCIRAITFSLLCMLKIATREPARITLHVSPTGGFTYHCDALFIFFVDLSHNTILHNYLLERQHHPCSMSAPIMKQASIRDIMIQPTAREPAHITLHASPTYDSTYHCRARFICVVDTSYSTVLPEHVFARAHPFCSMGAHITQQLRPCAIMFHPTARAPAHITLHVSPSDD